MDTPIREFEVKKEFSTGPEEAKVNYEVGAVTPFRDDAEFVAKIADGSLVEVPAQGSSLNSRFPDTRTAEEVAAARVRGELNGSDTRTAAEIEAARLNPPVTPPVHTLKFAGQVVVSNGIRTVVGSGAQVHHLTLVDGSSQDVSDEDYAAAVEASK
jgi:hypothetical protein